MPCTDQPTSSRPAHRLLAVGALLALVAACTTVTPPSPSPAPAPAPGKPTPPSGGAAPKPRAGGTVSLPAPSTPHSWADARLQAARRLVAANPEGVYTGAPPDILLAIPVMTIELNGDGSIRHIDVMRYPSQARDTVDLAMQAIRRAAPFGDVSKLPKPWKFNETFLFNDDRKFKPMTLDQR